MTSAVKKEDRVLESKTNCHAWSVQDLALVQIQVGKYGSHWVLYLHPHCLPQLSAEEQ